MKQIIENILQEASLRSYREDADKEFFFGLIKDLKKEFSHAQVFVQRSGRENLGSFNAVWEDEQGEWKLVCHVWLDTKGMVNTSVELIPPRGEGFSETETGLFTDMEDSREVARWFMDTAEDLERVLS